MKISLGFLALLFSAVVLSGCSTCGKKSECSSCSGQNVAAPAVAAPAVATAPVVAAPVAPAAPKKMTEEQIMAAVRK